MSTIKRSELDAAIAVEVIGSDMVDDISGIPMVVNSGNGMPHAELFLPSTDLNHAFEALEKYGNCRNYDVWRNESIFDPVVTPETFCVTLKLSNGIHSSARAIHKSLAIAICLALLSAVRGEQVELEDE